MADNGYRPWSDYPGGLTMKYLMKRGPTERECRLMCSAAFLKDRDRLIINVIYETWYRRHEVTALNIKDYDRKTGELTAQVTKGWGNESESRAGEPRHMILSPNTQAMMNKYIGNRKRGPLFLNPKGKRLTPDRIRQMVHRAAQILGIQKIHHYTDGEKVRYLITPKSIREAGERHTDQHGADSDTTAIGAGHSPETKAKSYKKSAWEEVQRQVREHHPHFIPEA